MPFARHRAAPVATIRSGAAVVSRRDRLDGYDTLYHHGGSDKPQLLAVPEPPRSTTFQPTTVQLQITRLYGYLFRTAQAGFGAAMHAGYPSFKVETLDGSYGPQKSAGPMRPNRRYTRVQRVPRYNATPRSYATRSSKKP